MAAGLAAALSAVLAIPALTIAGGAASAAAPAQASPFQQNGDQVSGDSLAVAGTAAAGAASRHVLAWGRNNFGQLGNGTTTDASTPARVTLPSGTKITQVRAGCHHTLALTARGHVLAWGLNSSGQLGNGSVAMSETPVRVRIPSGTKVIAIRAGCDYSLALTSRGHVLAWGDNFYGQLGNGSTTDSHVPVRTDLPTGTRVRAISAGDNFALARTAGGHALAWGQNSIGELGNDSNNNSDVPVGVDFPPGAKVTIISAGYNFALARVAGSGQFSYFAWGANNLGQFGDGTTTSTASPVQVMHIVQGPGHFHLTSLFAGCGHTLALFSDGAMLAWGANSEGQLGNGTTTSSDGPVLVQLGSAKVAAISASCVDSYALTRKGRVLAWGYGAAGQLGNGGTTSSDRPVRAGLPGGWRAVAIGSGPVASHVLAILHRK